jgi:hypothetical protein
MPSRIQLQRSKGWRKPTNAVKVDRSTKWGNPFRAATTFEASVKDCVESYRQWLSQDEKGKQIAAQAKAELRGKDLACWCKPGEPCHADVLLELANK